MRILTTICIIFFQFNSLAQYDSTFNLYVKTKESQEVKVIREAGILMNCELNNDAIRLIRSFIRENENFYEGHYILGFIYKKSKKYDRAIKHFTEAIKISPKSAEPYFFRGNCYIETGNYSAALSDYQMTIRFLPQLVLFSYEP